MRVSSFMISRTVLRNISQSSRRLMELQNRMASGRRISALSDDPVVIPRLLELKSSARGVEQFERNVDSAREWLSAAEGSLSELVELLSQASAVAEQGANDAMGPDGRRALATTVNEMLEEMLQTANRKHAGKYVFAGVKNSTAPYAATRDTDTGWISSVSAQVESWSPIVRAVDKGVTVAAGVTGDDIFGDVGDTSLDPFEVLITLRDALSSNDTEGISSSIDYLGAALDQVQDELHLVGARERQLDTFAEKLSESKVRLESARSQLEDADVAEAALLYQQEQTALSAALQVGARLIQMNLLNYI